MFTWFNNLKIKSKIIAGNGIAILLLSIFASIVYKNTNKLLETSNWVQHTEEAIAVGHRITEELLNMETGQRGFLITGQSEFLEPYYKGKGMVFEELDFAKNLVSDNSEQVKVLIKIERLANKWLSEAGEREIYARKMADEGSGSLVDVEKLIGNKTGKNIMDELRQHLTDFIETEKKLLAKRQKVNDLFAKSAQMIILIGTFISLFIILISGQKIATSIASPVGFLEKVVKKIGEGDLSVRSQIKGGDEVASLSSGIDLMAVKLKEANDALIEAKNMAENASKSKSEFLANMSHEIRTPMTSILGMAELLMETKLDSEQKDLVSRLNRSGDALIRIVDDILDLSKVEAGLIELENVSFNIDEELEKIFSIFSVKANQKGIELKRLVTPGLPSRFLGDPVRFRQILVNLVGNAVKFTSHGEVAISVEGELEESASEETYELKVSIIDTGIGIPKDKLESIFGEFSQADSSTTRHYGGTGLGLTISRKLARLMGGELEVQSEEGAGSIFTFKLSMKSDTYQRIDGEEPAKQLGKKVEHPLNILLAEDSEDNRKLIIDFLKKTPHTLDVVENGEEAVEVFTKKKYDLVLMDMQMPVMDGYSATRIIREWEDRNDKKRTPVIAFTAFVMKEEVEKCLRAGCTGHLAKPINKKKLIESIYTYSLSKA